MRIFCNELPGRSILSIVFASLSIITCDVTLSSALADEIPAAEKQVESEHYNGQKAQIMQLVREYFVARDKGWVAAESSALAEGKLASGQVEAQPIRQASAIATVAEQIVSERGLQAVAVQTGLARKNNVRLHGNTATATVTVGTALTWNFASVGESSLSDVYVVKLERKDKTWSIVDVAYAPIPSTEIMNKRTRMAAVTGAPETAAVPIGDPAPAVALAPAAASGWYDRKAAAAYANAWSGSIQLSNGEVEDLYNPAYDMARQDNDCTDFASQVLAAGGWPIHDGWANDNPVNWSPDLWGLRGPSQTWSVASWLFDYASNSKRGEKKGIWPSDDGNLDIWNLELGDLVFVDWDPNGHYDGAIDHAMVISGTYTELGFTEPTFSQHTPHRHNMPLSVGIKIATAPIPSVDPGDGLGGQGRVPKYHPVHIQDSFTVE
ncbi:MAG: amidase domain-containing protein [Gammaproteobacteria bacterium]|nr:amidase domain-containing protein [Gammaproteobacteria bacterium]